MLNLTGLALTLLMKKGRWKKSPDHPGGLVVGWVGSKPRESDGHWSVLVVVGSREGIVEKE